MSRCYDNSSKQYPNYGGRGIKVHPNFHTKRDFVNYVRSLPNANIKLSIDRIDNDKNYEPGNLRWATQKQQARNTRLTIFTTYKGEPIAAKEFAEHYVTKYLPQQVARLAKQGLTGEEILERESKSTRAGLRYNKRGAKA